MHEDKDIMVHHKPYKVPITGITFMYDQERCLLVLITSNLT